MSSIETVFSRTLRRPNSRRTTVEAIWTAKINPAMINNSRETDMLTKV